MSTSARVTNSRGLSPNTRIARSSSPLAQTMKLAFSTLGCPHWELERIAQAARAYGYAAIELRAVSGDLDLLKRPECQPGTVETTRRWLTDQALSICCVDTSCTFDSRDEDERREQVEVAVRHAALAAALG